MAHGALLLVLLARGVLAGGDGHLIHQILERASVLVRLGGVFLAAQNQKRIGQPVQQLKIIRARWPAADSAVLGDPGNIVALDGGLGERALHVGALHGVRILGEVRFQGADQVHRAGAFVHGAHQVLLLFEWKAPAAVG